MEKDDINISDWERILTGENPWLFLVEVFFRTVVISQSECYLLGIAGDLQITVNQF